VRSFKLIRKWGIFDPSTFFRQKIEFAPKTNSASLPISKYKLDMLVHDLAGLTEFSQTENAVYGRRFDGEANFNAPPLEFLNCRWTCALGTVGGKVYKIALYFESVNKSRAIEVSAEVMQYCQQRLGRPTVSQEALFIWNLHDGNVVLQLGKAEDTYTIGLFSTSRTIEALAAKH
jgi:hypothetical protein